MQFNLAFGYTIIRLVLPLVLLGAILFRQNIFSSIYLLLLLIGPILPKPNISTVLSGSVGIYLKCVIIISLIISCCHVLFQIILFSVYSNYHQSIDYCSNIGKIYNLIGLHRYDGISVVDILRLCGTDFFVLIASGILYTLVRKSYNQQIEIEKMKEEEQREQEAKRLERERRLTEAGLSTISVAANKKIQEKYKKKLRKQKASVWAYYILETLFLILLCASAILNPSASSAIYFLTFLFIATWLSLNRQFNSFYYSFRVILALYSSIHFIILFIYQMEIFRPLLPPDDLMARVFGLIDYVEANCTTVRVLEYQDLHWATYVHPLSLICLYFISITLIRVTVFRKSQVLNVVSQTNAIADADQFSPRNNQIRCELRSDDLTTPRASSLMPTSNVKKIARIRDKTYVVDGDHQDDVVHLDDLNVRSNDCTPLLSDDRTGKNYNTSERRKSLGNKSGIEMDVNGSIIWKPETEQSSQMNNVGLTSQNISRAESPGNVPEASKTAMFPLIQFAKLIKRGSYVGTLIIMMAWSITYHSWLSFLFLLWSCVIWMIPNSRRACLKSSPFLVIYALLLLIGQYVYGMNLKSELPESIGPISLSEIGFKKYGYLSYQPLFIKIFYTLMFWLTLRQYQEEKEREKRKALAQGIAVEPFNISFGTGQGGLPRQDIRRQMSLATTAGTYQSPVVQWVFGLIKDLLIKYWIWVVACMLMVMSLSGDKVVLYRIVYMFLFLSFVLIFQFSFLVWKKLMYVFWLTVIVYSMIILTAIYTYQFNKFPEYWNEYLGVSEELQHDLGLTVYGQDAWILFKELFTPTFFLIITIIQVHFLHKDFLEFSNLNVSPSRTSSPTNESAPSPIKRENIDNEQNIRELRNDEVKLYIESKSEESSLSSPKTVKSNANRTDSSFSFVTPKEQASPKLTLKLPKDDQEEKKEMNQSSIEEIIDLLDKTWNICKPYLDELIEIFFRLLEIHLIKVILYCAVIISIVDISAMNIVYIFLVIIGISITRFETLICHLLGLWTGILILLKMIFQLQVAQDIAWHTNCTNSDNNSSQYPFNETIDNREYIGFRKTDNIFSYTTAYVILILVLTVNSVVRIRQEFVRYNKNMKSPPIGIVFLNVSRKDADKTLKQMLMFFVNFGFYKFGIEICFTLLIASIGSRNDIFSVVYSIWLFILVLVKRNTLSKIWPIFIGFFATFLPIQYLLCLGIPPGLCFNYPWNLDDNLREWLFLSDFKHPLAVNRLYLDFIIFLFSCRQYICFQFEKVNHIGGSNTEAHLESAESNRDNIKDLFTESNTVFDSMKSLFFFCFFWITLAVVFLAGTLRVSLFALGYVLGCFIFLWNGNEFYLKPIKLIFKLWNTLIGYTCCVILLKSMLQVVGCVYISCLTTSGDGQYCWVVQLFGIACLKNCNFDCETSPTNIRPKPCNVSYEEASLFWDGMCFAFLIIQRRIFSSYYFFHLIKEIKAQQVLASRGAELIHEIQAKEVADQEQAEKEVMEKIKQKMDRIKAAQQRMFADKAKSIKYHKQEEDFGYDISPYFSTAEEPSFEPEEPLSHTLPTVYSPTPSLPTVGSPQSAASLQPDYLEVYRVGPLLPIDHRISTLTFPSIQSSPSEESLRFYSPLPYPPTRSFGFSEGSLLKTYHPEPSTSQTRQPIKRPITGHEPLSRSQSMKRRLSTQSVPSHGSSVKSGGYYMFGDVDSEIVDLNEKPRKSLIPDPEGDELRKIAKMKGFTIFCSKMMKGEDLESLGEAKIFSGEYTEIGESSKDSAIVSADREIIDIDASGRTTITSLPSTSKAPTESRPSTVLSHDVFKSPEEREDKFEQEKIEESGRKLSLFSRFKHWLFIIKLFIESCLISLTSSLNDLSRDYRYVEKRLLIEKRYLKRLFDIEEIEGFHHDFMDAEWKKKTLAKISAAAVGKEFQTDVRKKDARIEVDTKSESKKAESQGSSFEGEIDNSYINSNVFMRFLRSCYYATLSRSEVICYIMIILNQLSSASVLSLPLPLMAFLWGSLSVPRPSKAFWISVITYTEFIVVVKYIFQFQFWPWPQQQFTDPFWEPRIIGIMKEENYAKYDLFLLLVLFFHRFMLKSLGLWDLSEKEIVSFMESVESEKSQSRDNHDTKPNSGSKKQKQSKQQKSILAQPENTLLIGGEKDEVGLKESKFIGSDEKDASYENLDPLEPLEDMLSVEVSDTINDCAEVTKTKVKKLVIQYTKPFVRFFHSVLHPPYRITRDVYTLMFICDFINFFVLVFGFNAFGIGYSGEDVASFFEENKIPIPFYVTVLIQFTLIVIDRALYLRKNIKGKLIFQILLVCGMHIWLFFALPAMTKRSFTEIGNWPPRMYYIFKCLYFLLSAFQIRSGYPTRILGNCFCKNYNFLNWYMFKGYMVIPFLYDLRLYMDWIWTETSLVLDEWSLMEDIFVNLFERKCELRLDEEFPEPRGRAKRRLWKYIIGGAWVALIIILLWGPLGLFAFGKAVGSPNRPVDVTIELEFGGFQPIFRMSVTGNPVDEISDSDWNYLKNNDKFSTDQKAQTFISGYDREDVSIVNLNSKSTGIWGVSPPSQIDLSESLNSSGKMTVKLTYHVTRKKQQKSQDLDLTISNERIVDLDPNTDHELRQLLAQMLSNDKNITQIPVLPFIFPNYLRVPEKGKPNVVRQLANSTDQNFDYKKNDSKFRNVSVLLLNDSMTSWWEVSGVKRDNTCDVSGLDPFMQRYLEKQNCNYLPIVLFNDKVFIGLLAFLSGYGIIGIYTTFVFLVSRWVRGLNSESSFKVIYTRMPNVDRVLQLCLDIYLVRESGEFELEEDLYAKLIFLYRSPETLIKWTKIAEELPANEQTGGRQQQQQHQQLQQYIK